MNRRRNPRQDRQRSRAYSPEFGYGSSSQPNRDRRIEKIRFSVFRPVTGLALAEVEAQFALATAQHTSRRRGEMNEYGLAATIMPKLETDDFRYKDGTTNKDIIDAVYEGVPTLRRPLDVTIGNIGVFGGRSNANKPFGLAIADGAGQLREERAQIIEIVEEFIDPESGYSRQDWPPGRNPHISLGRIQLPRATDTEVSMQIKREVRPFLPEGIVKLQRAEFRS